MKLNKPSLIAVATALTSLLLTPSALAATAGEKTPLNLKDATGDTPSHVGGGGSIVRTIVGLAVVIDEEFGLRVTDVVSASHSTLEDEAGAAAADAAAQAEADLLAAQASGALDPLGAPFAHGDSLADASVDDISMGSLPTPGTLA